MKYLRDMGEQVAWSLHGLPYRWGGDDPMTGFDCSGLCIEILKSVGVLTRSGDWTAQGLYDKWNHQGHKASPYSGCLVFWQNRRKTRIIHVEYCLDHGLTMGASGGGSKTTSEDAASSQNAYIKVRPTRKPYYAILDPYQELEL